MKNLIKSTNFKTRIVLFFILIFSQFAFSQLTNPGTADGPRAVIPSQAGPRVKTPVITRPELKACNCNPNGFNPFSYSYESENLTVMTEHQFEVKCNIPFKLDGGYKCDYSSKICAVKFKAEIKNGDGIVIKTINPFTFPMVEKFSAAGFYVVEITPICGGITCEKPRFHFNVKCDEPQACKCSGTQGWVGLSAIIDGKPKALKCGVSLTIKQSQKFGIKGQYKCKGNCDTVLKGSIVNETTGETTNFDSINLDGNPLNFPNPGKYKLIITPVCKNDKCEPCIIYVTVY